MMIVNFVRHNHEIFLKKLFILLFLGLSLPSCVLKKTNALSLDTPSDPEDVQAFQRGLRVKKVQVCEPVRSWVMQAPVKSARLYWEGKDPFLVWQGVFKTAQRTLLQNLTPSLKFKGHPIKLGAKQANSVYNFKLYSPNKRLSWATYQYRRKNSRINNMMVEYVKDGKAKNIDINLPRGETVLQYWVIPSKRSSEIDIITRTVSTRPGTSNVSSFSYYRWFHISGERKSSRLLGVFADRGATLNSPTFVFNPNIRKPAAYYIKRNKNSNASTLFFHNVFQRKSRPQTLSRLPSYGTQLVAQSESIGSPNVALAWISETEDNPYPTLHWGLSKVGNKKGRTKLFFTEKIAVEHLPSDLTLVAHREGKRNEIYMHWLALQEGIEFGFVLHRIAPFARKKMRNRTVRLTKSFATTVPSLPGHPIGVGFNLKNKSQQYILIGKSTGKKRFSKTKITACSFKVKL